MLRRIYGTTQHYDWGDTSSLPTLLGETPDGTPWAEVWFGTHHIAPSHVDAPDGPSLESVTGEMNMLVKLLACDKPLSLQTHPNVQQAQRGFQREETAGVPLNATNRMYKDASDKPEMLIALTPFEALCGFADIDASVGALRALSWDEEADVLDQNGIDGYILWAFDQLDVPPLTNAPSWLQRIAELHPADKGLRVAPLLNHITLNPGEAIALPAGNLHAYLHGTGLEIMKSSDNVVRAGFTSKHIDVAELQRIMDTSVLPDPITHPTTEGNWSHYASPTPAFSVASVTYSAGFTVNAEPHHRFLFGTFSGSHPTMMLLPAGESATLENSGTAWVITQN